MGLSAREVGDSSMWQMSALYSGFLKSKGVQTGGGAPSDEAFERALREAHG